MRRILIAGVLLGMGLLYTHPITVDGDPSDWIGSLPGVDEFHYSAGEGIWHDAEGDDLGDGGDAPNAPDDPGPYTYPDTSLFLGTEADLVEWRITVDTSAQMIYFLIKNAGYDVIWTPWVGIAIDLDHEYGSGQVWLPEMADLKVDSLNAWEYLIRLWNNNIQVNDPLWNDVTYSSVVVFDTANDVIEVGWDVSQLVPNPFDFEIFYVTVYAGLEEFGAFREVDSTSSLWHAGGGITGETDPDVYDLCFVDSADQSNDLNSYTASDVAVIRPTTVGQIIMSFLSVGEGNGDEKDFRIELSVSPSVIRRYARISFEVEEKAMVTIKLFDISGRSIDTLLNSQVDAGSHEFVIDTRTLKDGVYFLILEASGKRKVEKMAILR
jgi:hypothetical protein